MRLNIFICPWRRKNRELPALYQNTSRITNHSKSLSRPRRELCFRPVKEKSTRLLPALLMLVFALSRIPGVLPQNFSAAYALAFCGGVYFTGAMAWWLPLGTLFATDILLNVFYYHEPVFSGYMLIKTLSFAALIGLGASFHRARTRGFRTCLNRSGFQLDRALQQKTLEIVGFLKVPAASCLTFAFRE